MDFHRLLHFGFLGLGQSSVLQSPVPPGGLDKSLRRILAIARALFHGSIHYWVRHFFWLQVLVWISSRKHVFLDGRGGGVKLQLWFV